MTDLTLKHFTNMLQNMLSLDLVKRIREITPWMKYQNSAICSFLGSRFVCVFCLLVSSK